MVPSRPGTMLSARRGRRIVAVVGADLEQRLGAFGEPAVVDERGGDHLRQRRHRRAGRDRVGGVGGDEQRRHVAAPQRALEARRNLHRKQHGARGERLIEFVFVAQLARDLEEVGVAQRRENGAADVARFLQQYGRRQVARHRIDRIAEHDELQERDRHHGRERHAIAAQLQQFLAQHGADAPPEAPGADGSQRRQQVHSKLSRASAIRAMNTSSSEALERCQWSPGRV